MISFKSYLIEAVNYEDMMKGVLKLEPTFNTFVKDQIAWAKKTLKKQDRITWYLGWLRFGQYTRDREGAGKDLYQKDVQKILKANKLEDMTSVYDETDAMKAGFRFSIGSQREVQEELEHFLSLKIEGIENYVFKPMVMWKEIKRTFTKLEEEWASAGEDEIRYSEQPFEEDAEMNEDNVIHPILDFGDGYFWVNLNTPYCRKEGNAMGHCGNTASATDDDIVLSFRKLTKRGQKQYWLWYPSMTFILDEKTGYLGEMKGRQNQKPDKKYHKYVLALLKLKVHTSSRGDKSDWYIKGIKGGGYAPERNFALADLTTEEQEELYAVRPNLMPIKEQFKKFGKTPELLDSIKVKMPSTFEWIDENWGIMEQHKGGLESFMEEYGNDTAKWIAKTLEDGYIETYDADTSMADDFIDSRKLEAYLEENHPDEKEDWEDDELQWAKDNVDGLEDALNSAAFSATEVGTYDEMVEWMDNRLDDIEILTHDEYDSGVMCVIKPEEKWEDPVKIYINFNNAMAFADQNIADDDSDYGSWKYQLKMDEPSYGFSGWSEEAGLDRLREEGFEHLL